VVVGLHATVNSRYSMDLADLDGTSEAGGYFRPFGRFGNPAFRMLALPRWQTSDLIASMIGHGMLTRFPKLKVAVVENFNQWTRPMLHHFQEVYDKTPQLFDENPMDVLKRNVFVHIFQDPNPVELIRMLGVENSMFGSDFPHPEGLRDPLAFSEQITDFAPAEQALIMGGNLTRLLGIGPK
jgi:predicted TIM-barrel fold metal-dependent hydrolase